MCLLELVKCGLDTVYERMVHKSITTKHSAMGAHYTLTDCALIRGISQSIGVVLYNTSAHDNNGQTAHGYDRTDQERK